MTLFNLPTRDSKETSLDKARKISTTNTKVTKDVSLTNSSVLLKYVGQFVTIKTLGALEDYINQCIVDGIVAIDTETTGLNPISDSIVGISLKSKSQKAVYIPINHISMYSRQRITTQLTETMVAPLIQKLVDNTATVWHNAVFDIRVLKWQLGVIVSGYNIYWDTLIGSHLLNENEPHGLKYLHNTYCESDDEIYKFTDLFGTNFKEASIDLATIYAGRDAKMTYDLFEFQFPFLNTDTEERYRGISNVFNNIEMLCVKVNADMEDNGIAIDEDYAKELAKKYNELLDQAQDNFYKELLVYEDKIITYNTKNFGKLSNPINHASPQQVAILLYDIIGIAPIDRNSPRGTGEDILLQINLPICEAILKCREYEKLLKTYIEKLPKEVNSQTNKIHCRFNACGTVTGRFSSSSPNLQNVPSKNNDIRKMFIADSGYVLVGSDYSQQEPRILAELSGDENLQHAYQDGKDLYAWVASLVYGLPYDECLKTRPDGTKNPDGEKRRDTLKAITLAIIYSKTPSSVATDLGITKQEADNIFETFFRTFPKVKQFIEDTQRMASIYGFVETAWGRKRRLPDMQLDPYEFIYDNDNLDKESTRNHYITRLNSCWGYKQRQEIVKEASKIGITIKQNDLKIADATRQCVNSRIQGSASDMIKIALVNLYYDSILNDLGFKLTMTIHDEIIGQCPIKNAKRVGERLSEVMILSAKEKISVPMKCDVEITKCWYGDVINV